VLCWIRGLTQLHAVPEVVPEFPHAVHELRQGRSGAAR